MKTRSITAAVRPALSQTPAWVLDLATIRRLEGRWLDETEPGELMACAGAAVARVAMAMWKNLPAHAPVILLVGPGNNGGDALVAGRILRRAGLAVWAAGMPGLDTTPPEAKDARAAWEAWRADGQVIHGFEQVADWLWPDGDAPDEDAPEGDDSDVPPAEPALIIDGLFGIGLARPLAGRVAELVRMVNRARVPVLAIDVPSGLDADRGAPVGDAEAPVMQARQTVTMIADKPGLHTGAGLRHAGRVWVAPLSDLPLEAELGALEAVDGPADAGEWRDLPTEAEAETDPDDGHNFDDSGMDDADADAPCPADEDSFLHELPGVLLTAPLAAALLPARARDAHKGNGGDVLVVGGRLGMAGAARLAAQGAAGAGAGRVWIAVEAEDCPQTGATEESGSLRPEDDVEDKQALAADAGAWDSDASVAVPEDEAADDEADAPQDASGKARQLVDPLHPEIMRFVWDADAALPGAAPVLVVGCGLGQDETAQQWLEHALASQAPLVIDADALGLLTEAPEAPCSILTPHPLEAARLLGMSVADVQADRPACARALAARFDAVAVLKGAGTVVAAPDGRLAINTSGHPVLATAGTGDVLAGTIAALLAGLLRAGCPPDEAAWQAACAGVWLHGRAGECLARRQGPRGVPAGALPGQYPGIMGSLSIPSYGKVRS
ncbi:MAG: NAD(P)H-hydrate dehydratase [Lautropia mirabilis]|nr:NAD(P)H-hydrate dehydratase [Lautropia mirabilis]